MKKLSIRIYKAYNPKGGFIYQCQDDEGLVENGDSELDSLALKVVNKVKSLFAEDPSLEIFINFQILVGIELRSHLEPKAILPLNRKEQHEFWLEYNISRKEKH